jgi:DNA-binding IclR family transcriptional regulator
MGAAVERTRHAAYSEIADTVTKGVSGVGCVFQASPSSLAAVSIGAITSRLSAPRKQELALLLMDEFTQAPAAAQTPGGK